MLKASGGKPASSTICARMMVESGVFSAGLMMMGLPAAIAGPILWQAKIDWVVEWRDAEHGTHRHDGA